MRPLQPTDERDPRGTTRHWTFDFFTSDFPLLLPCEKLHKARKAHANLADVEDRLLAGLRKANPDLVESDGSCPQCVSLEHELADEYHAQAAASKLTEG